MLDKYLRPTLIIKLNNVIVFEKGGGDAEEEE
jgi:hypothetical protein